MFYCMFYFTCDRSFRTHAGERRQVRVAGYRQSTMHGRGPAAAALLETVGQTAARRRQRRR